MRTFSSALSKVAKGTHTHSHCYSLLEKAAHRTRKTKAQSTMADMASRPNPNSRNNTQRPPLPSPHFNNHRPLPPPPSRAPLNIHNTHPSPPPLPPSRPDSNSQNVRYPSPRRLFGYNTTSSNSSSASLRGCCCCLCLLFSFIALLAVAIVLVVVLAVKPKKPQFDLQRVGVQYMGITAPNLFSLSSSSADAATTTATSASLSLNIRLLFTAVNPNKVGIKYGKSRFTVMYRGIPLGKAIVPGFYQEAHSQREVVATIAVDRVNLLQADAADLIRDASLNDRVELRVLGEVGAKIRVLDFDSPGVQVSVDCSIVISPRNQSLSSKQCGFDGFSL